MKINYYTYKGRYVFCMSEYTLPYVNNGILTSLGMLKPLLSKC